MTGSGKYSIQFEASELDRIPYSRLSSQGTGDILVLAAQFG